MPEGHQSGQFSILPTSASVDKRVGPAAHQLLSLLSSYADEEGWCWPSQKTLAERLGISERSVRERLATLEETGYVVSERQFRADGAETSTRRRLVYDRPWKATKAVRPSPAGGAEKASNRGGAHTHQTGSDPENDPIGSLQAREELYEIHARLSDKLYEIHARLSGVLTPGPRDQDQIAAWVTDGVDLATIEAAYSDPFVAAAERPWGAFRAELGRLHASGRRNALSALTEAPPAKPDWPPQVPGEDEATYQRRIEAIPEVAAYRRALGYTLLTDADAS